MQERTPNFEIDRALRVFYMATKFKINSSKTKDCRVLKRQSLNLMKIGHQGAVLQERTPNFELDRALEVFNKPTKFKIDSSKPKDSRALTRQMLTHARTHGRTDGRTDRTHDRPPLSTAITA